MRNKIVAIYARVSTDKQKKVQFGIKPSCPVRDVTPPKMKKGLRLGFYFRSKGFMKNGIAVFHYKPIPGDFNAFFIMDGESNTAGQLGFPFGRPYPAGLAKPRREALVFEKYYMPARS
jgi:hypothetical protein